MSLKKKDLTSTGTTTTTNGLRVATDDPHLVSLGGGRLSTAVTIHPLPIGDLTIGSSPKCGVHLNGTGVQPHHCTLYRSEMNQVTLVPEGDARTLIDGNKIHDETILTQGAMLTIGKSNYLRFNNPAEAELIKSTMGSNERISMPQIDFTQDSSSSNEGSPEEVFQNLNDFLESQNNYTSKNKKSFFESPQQSSYNNYNHSPKVFAADSITVNASAKDVLGAKYNNFAKNLPQNSVNYAQNNINGKFYGSHTTNTQQPPTAVLTKINNNLMNGNAGCTSPKIQPLSACYDRYPKPGSYGSLQVFPMNGINMTLNNEETDAQNAAEAQRQRAQLERMKEEELSRLEQERLDEIIKMCAEYEKQQCQAKATSPIVPNRIKTNGMLPRDKKIGDMNSFGDHPTSPTNTLYHNHSSNVFFPAENHVEIKKPSSSGYENVSFVHDRKTDRRIVEINGSNEQTAKYVPQSPRTKIKTCISPKSTDKRNEYDILAQSFEDRLRKEIQSLRENKNYEDKTSEQSTKLKNFLNLNININHDDETHIQNLKQTRDVIITKVRDLKTQISELQRQEDEVYREFDLEKVLVSAELQTELNSLCEMERNCQKLQNQVHRLEAQRNSNRVMQETQQSKLKQSIDVKQGQINGLERLIDENKTDESLHDELNITVETLENDRKMFEDLEFQYLEEETEWMAEREEINKELKALTNKIVEKKYQIKNLEKSDVDNQKIATSDTKILESNILTMLKDLEQCREELKIIDNEIFTISGQQNTPHSESDDEPEIPLNYKLKMSNSLFGSNEILAPRAAKPQNDIMSKSVNENLIFSNNIIEMTPIDFTSTPYNCKAKSSSKDKQLEINFKSMSLSNDSLNRNSIKSGSSTASSNTPVLFQRDHPTESDPLLKLKYNLNASPPSETKSKSTSPSVNLNLSLESDDFEVNPLDKRVPSQDDIDRISKVTLDAPISMQGASYKVKESIKEIERNRQLLLAQQGTHVIEHERQKMNELKKKVNEEAKAQYLKQNGKQENGEERRSGSYFLKSTQLEEVQPNSEQQEKQKYEIIQNINIQNSESIEKNESSPLNQQRHSHPELDSNQHRPLSEISDASYDQLDKPYLSTNDICISTNGLNNDADSSGQTSDSNRNSFASQNEDAQKFNSNSSNNNGKSRLMSGVRRNLVPKSQRPLTRYLPIMSSHLDLRQHVEKAGHQITLCPHVIIDEFSCRGYLHKLGATFHGWSRRWFVFDRQKRALIYYSDKSERKPRGGAYFTTIDDVYLDHLNTSKSGRPHCTFIIKTKKRSYHLQAASDAAARIWIDVIITGAQGNIDY